MINQKKRRLAALQNKLAKLNQSEIKLCFGTKKLFLAQYQLEDNGYTSHNEWLSDWRKTRTSSFMMVGSKTYGGGNQLCGLDTKGNLAITVPPCLVKNYGGKVTADHIAFRYGQEFIDLALSPTRYKRGKSYRNGTEKAVTHRFVRKNDGGGRDLKTELESFESPILSNKVPFHGCSRLESISNRRVDNWYLHTHVELPDIPTISSKANGTIGIDLNVNSIGWAYCDREGNLKDRGHSCRQFRK